MLNAYINAIQECPNYDSSNKLSELLPFIERLTESQVEKLIKAFNENGQVHDSYGFNGKNPRYYGDGLPYHLKRITNIDFKLSVRDKIIRV